MISFLDGPAAGQSLALLRAPVMLRVVRSVRGTFDALDQVNDVPREGETIHVYRMTEYGGFYHASCRPRSKSYWSHNAVYVHFDPQPLEMHVRDNANWREWCEAQRDTVPVPAGWKPQAMGGQS